MSFILSRCNAHILLTTLFSLLLIGMLLPPVPEAHADISTGLQGHWKFDEGPNPSAADSSGNGNTGTLVGGPARVAGKIGQALSFDGVDDHVSIPDAPSLDGMNTLTVALWVKGNVPSLGQAGIIEKVSGAYMMDRDSNDLIDMSVRDNSGNRASIDNIPVAAQKHNHTSAKTSPFSTHAKCE